MRAIQTEYKGYKFRSRLEARWAVFFDAMGMQWEYEKEGYDLGDAGWYLPDFWIPMDDEWNYGGIDKITGAKFDKWPSPGFWYEIKSVDPTEDEINKISALAKLTKHTSTIIVGDPGNCKFLYAHNSGNIGWRHYYNCHPDDTRNSLEPYELNELSLEEMARQYFVIFGQVITNGYGYYNAIVAARSARFEHGEQPSTLKQKKSVQDYNNQFPPPPYFENKIPPPPNFGED